MKDIYRCEDTEGRSFEIDVRSNSETLVRGVGDGAYFKNQYAHEPIKLVENTYCLITQIVLLDLQNRILEMSYARVDFSRDCFEYNTGQYEKRYRASERP